MRIKKLEIFEGIVNALTWTANIIKDKISIRQKKYKAVMDGILHFEEGGEISEKSKQLVEYLEKECEFVGFVPSVSYVMKDDKISENIENIWVHPFSVPTLLFKVKGVPLLVIANPNLCYNESVLQKIDFNRYNSELMTMLKNSRGLNG